MVIEYLPMDFLAERAAGMIDNGLAMLMGAAGAGFYGFLKNDV
jgi:hypothetical protein